MLVNQRAGGRSAAWSSLPVQGEGWTQCRTLVEFHSSECRESSVFGSDNSVCTVLHSGLTPSLSMNKGPCSLTIAKSLGPKVLCIAPFTIDFTFFLSQSCGFETLPTLGTAEAVFVPGLSGSHYLLGSIDRIPTPGTLLSTSIFLGKFRSVWICCRPVRLSTLWLDAQPLPAVHVERASALAITVAFWAVLFPIAGFAVDLVVMDRHRCAV